MSVVRRPAIDGCRRLGYIRWMANLRPVAAHIDASAPLQDEPADAGIPGAEEAQQLADTFQVLADPGRIRLIAALVQAGELRVGELAAASGLSETACSHSLRLLRAARVVRHRKDGRSVFYCLDDAHVQELLGIARAHVQHD